LRTKLESAASLVESRKDTNSALDKGNTSKLKNKLALALKKKKDEKQRSIMVKNKLAQGLSSKIKLKKEQLK
jgi:hypothetical protein